MVEVTHAAAGGKPLTEQFANLTKTFTTMLAVSNISPNPSKALIKEETEHLLLCFCTFCSLIKRAKNLSLQNIFILVLQEKKLRNILKDLLTIETNFDVVKLFIDFEPQ